MSDADEESRADPSSFGSRPRTANTRSDSRESDREERHERLMKIVADHAAKPRGDDGESEDGRPVSAQRKSRFRGLSRALTGALSFSPPGSPGDGRRRSSWMSAWSSANLGEEDEEEEEDDEEGEDDGEGRVTLKRQGTIAPETARDRAYFKLGIEQIPEDDEGRWLQFQRRSGLLRLRVAIVTKKIVQEEDGPRFEELHALATDIRFELFIGIMILINGIFIAIETFYKYDDKPAYLDTGEHLFTVIFLIEFFIRIMAFEWVWVFSLMNLFDIFLVWVTGVLVMWVLIPAGVDAAVLRRLGALRILRLARVCRAFRIMPFFKELWMLVQGVMECCSLLVWTILIGAIVHYTFAISVIELIAKNEMFVEDEAVQYYFGSLPRAMLSLFQIMTFDSWAAIVRPIVNADPKSFVVFGLFMGLAGIVLFNLMTAIVVRNAFDAAAADAEAVARNKAQMDGKIRQDLKEMFEDLDEDNSGALSIEEFLECLDDFAFVRKMKTLDIDLEELPDIFEILDDGDGQVDQDEFISGMMRMQGPAMSSEMLKATCGMRFQNVHFIALEDAFVQNAMEVFKNTDGHVDHFHDNMNSLIELTADLVVLLDKVGLRQVVKGSAPQLPFIMDPTMDEVQKAEKLKLKRQKNKKKTRGGKVTEAAKTEEETHPESFVKKMVPPEWIIRNNRSPNAMNPGKVKLQTNRGLKEKLLGQKPQKKKKKDAKGVCKEFGQAWEFLDLPLTDDGVIDRGTVEGRYTALPSAPPVSANPMMPWLIAESENVPESQEVPETPLQLPVAAAGSQGPPAASPAPNAATAAATSTATAAAREVWHGADVAKVPAAKAKAAASAAGTGASSMSLTPQERTGSKASQQPQQPQHPHAVP